MIASEFIQRLQSLINVVGDVDVVIEQSIIYGDMELSGFYELCSCETQGVITGRVPSGHSNLIYTDNYITDKDKVLQVIKIY